MKTPPFEITLRAPQGEGKSTIMHAVNEAIRKSATVGLEVTFLPSQRFVFKESGTDETNPRITWETWVLGDLVEEGDSPALVRTALEYAQKKLKAYVGVCKDDKELTGKVLPAIQAALASMPSTETEIENFMAEVDAGVHDEAIAESIKRCPPDKVIADLKERLVQERDALRTEMASKPREVWVNFYPSGCCSTWHSKAFADDRATAAREGEAVHFREVMP